MAAQRQSKLCSLAEAAASVPDGARIAFGGFAVYQHPTAFAHELIRQKRRDLTIVGVANGIEADVLIGAGCVKRIETSYVGLEKHGLARNFRRKAEAGAIDVVDYPELTCWDRFRANQENFTFWPADFLGGTDIVRLNPDIKSFTCPVTGRMLWAVPPADPDVVVIHAILGDEYGNVLIPGRRLIPHSLDVTLSRSCDNVIVTVERIVGLDEIKRRPHLNEVPSFRTKHIVEVPWGAHPNEVLGVYLADDRHFQEYVAASASEESFAAYLDNFVYGVSDHTQYLEKVGLRRLLEIQQVDIPQ